MVVKGEIEGLRKGTLYLQKIKDSVLIDIDSLTVEGVPRFEFKQEIITPEVYFLYLNKEDNDSLNDRILFFGEKGEIVINTLLNTFESSAKVTGSENQVLLQEYRSISRKFDEQNLNYIKGYLSAIKTKLDNAEIDSIQNGMDNLLNRRYLYALNFASNNGDNVIAPYIALTEVYDANIKLLDTVASKLSGEVKDSKYGKELLEFIAKRKQNGE
jgi:hypothetical protein